MVVSKFPTVGKSKTRLGKDIGLEQSAAFARASLVDLLERFAAMQHIHRVLLFKPASAKASFKALLRELKLQNKWKLLAAGSGDSGSDLGPILEEGLNSARKLASESAHDWGQSVVFIGSDCIDISPRHVRTLLGSADDRGAMVMPATDGGYVALGIGGSVPSDKAFEKVEWSTKMTCVTQIRALNRAGASRVDVGETLSDVDTMDDLIDLSKRVRAMRPEMVRLGHFSNTKRFLASLSTAESKRGK